MFLIKWTNTTLFITGLANVPTPRVAQSEPKLWQYRFQLRKVLNFIFRYKVDD